MKVSDRSDRSVLFDGAPEMTVEAEFAEVTQPRRNAGRLLRQLLFPATCPVPESMMNDEGKSPASEPACETKNKLVITKADDIALSVAARFPASDFQRGFVRTDATLNAIGEGRTVLRKLEGTA